jgi:hypothetical protein
LRSEAFYDIRLVNPEDLPRTLNQNVYERFQQGRERAAFGRDADGRSFAPAQCLSCHHAGAGRPAESIRRHPDERADSDISSILLDKAVLITGGGSGIGAALTRGLCVRQGAKGGVHRHRRGAKPGELAERLAGTSRHAPLFIHADLKDLEAIRLAVAQAEAAHGPARVLVNNAAL